MKEYMFIGCKVEARDGLMRGEIVDFTHKVRPAIHYGPDLRHVEVRIGESASYFTNIENLQRNWIFLVD